MLVPCIGFRHPLPRGVDESWCCVTVNDFGQEPAPRRAGPLDGIVVADFTRVLAGPLATMTLGDLGADVVKVERPGAGDETRGWQPPTAANGQSTYFLAVNRNKRSIALDLSTSDGRSAAKALALGADVVVENFRPGTMERFGLGYETLATQRPALIYASLTSFGRGGGDAAGYDFLVQAVGGLMSVTGSGDGDPTKVGVAVVDVLAGQNLVAGILAALLHRERTGQGQRVEVDLLSSVLAGLVNQASAYLNAGVVPGRLGNRHPSIAPYQAVAAADRLVVLAVGNDGQFRRLAAVLAAGPHCARAGRRSAIHDQRRPGRERRRAQRRPAAGQCRPGPPPTGWGGSPRPGCRVGRSTPWTRRSSWPPRSGCNPWCACVRTAAARSPAWPARSGCR